MENLIDQETLTVRLVRRWITNNTLPMQEQDPGNLDRNRQPAG